MSLTLRKSRSRLSAAALLALALVTGCQSPDPTTRPLYKLNQRELDTTIRTLHETQPDFRERLVTLARRNVGQPYEIYLLGEAPFDRTDPQPVYNLKKSDCVVFLEHMTAMSLSDSFPSFLTMLQRIRYKDGYISCLTRNHYTEADWNQNNGRWLLHEITTELDPNASVYTQKVDRANFFRTTFGVLTNIPVQTIHEPYIPYDHMDAVKPLLRNGDVINFVKGDSATSGWVHHVGIVAVMPDGAVHIIHSTEPRVREETIDAFMKRAIDAAPKLLAKHKPIGRGFKFLRFAEDPIANLKAIDGPDAPKVTAFVHSPISWDAYVKEVAGE
ncbi:MAG: DUF1460 domain-containing protein [Tepidisphaeraceae bacterium]